MKNLSQFLEKCGGVADPLLPLCGTKSETMPGKTFSKIFVALLLLAVFVSCKENDNEITGTAKVTFTNAALNSAAADIYVDEVKITPASIAYGNTTGTPGNPYLEMNAGIRAVKIIPASGANPVVEGNLVISAGNNYSIFTYDTLDAYSHLKALIVSDNLTAPVTGKAKVRFFQLSPDAGYVDAVIYHTGDTTAFLGNAYIGNTAGSEALSTYFSIDAGQYTL